MNNDDFNDFVPSIIRPRTIRKSQGNISLTQNSIASCSSLSLKRRNNNSVKKFNEVKSKPKENLKNTRVHEQRIDDSNKENLKSTRVNEQRIDDSNKENLKSTRVNEQRIDDSNKENLKSTRVNEQRIDDSNKENLKSTRVHEQRIDDSNKENLKSTRVNEQRIDDSNKENLKSTRVNEQRIDDSNKENLKSTRVNEQRINDLKTVDVPDKENLGYNTQNIIIAPQSKTVAHHKAAESNSLQFSDIVDIGQDNQIEDDTFINKHIDLELLDKHTEKIFKNNTVSLHKATESNHLRTSDIIDINENRSQALSNPFSFVAAKDCTKHTEECVNSDILSVTFYAKSKAAPSEISERIKCDERPVISITFSLSNCNKVDLSSKKSNVKMVSVEHEQSGMNVDCEIVEGSHLSEVTEYENILDINEFPNETKSPKKRRAATINLEIKKQKLTTGDQSTDKVLILKTNAIEKLSHVIVQPPNYKLVKQNIHDKNKAENSKRKSLFGSENNVIISAKGCHLKQKSIDTYFKSTNVLKTKQPQEEIAVELLSSNDWKDCNANGLVRDDAQEMNKNSGVVDIKFDGRTCYKSSRNESAKSQRQTQRLASPKAGLKASMSDVPRNTSPRSKKESSGSFSPKRPTESLQFSLPIKSKSNKNSIAPQSNIPYYKIVAGTHFAVDAFSYGEIPNVKHYFLTHFHSDHYSGLKKSFNKLLLCSKITAELCTSRLGVNSKYIQVINIDETIKIEGVEVSVIDANHCPGAIMLVFTLPNGKSILHTGDFRASPAMESSPVFWNKDIHTVYLDTTYCNPRYDFPTQDDSLEMALYILRQKKMALEKVGKKFSSVLIVCGTYTIGKEKFFVGMARRVGCSVWACPEKERVLRAVDSHSPCRAAPQACQLHVVPMRDLTHEKLRSYLDSMQGTFSEVVAFKPSGWENGKNSSEEKDSVTIHGIPYSEHSSFSELIRFVKFLQPKQVVPTVDISGGIKAVQKYFPCPLVNKDYIQCQSRLTDFFSIQSRQPGTAVT